VQKGFRPLALLLYYLKQYVYFTAIMARRFFSGFSAEQLAELPGRFVTWPSALGVGGVFVALGWTGTTVITTTERESVKAAMEARFTAMDKTMCVCASTRVDVLKHAHNSASSQEGRENACA